MVSGPGTINGTCVLQNGTMRPGNLSSPGQIRVNGDLTMNAGSTLDLKLYDGGTHQVTVTGTARLAGQIDLSYLGYTPRAGDSFDVLFYNARQGTFAYENDMFSIGDGLAVQIQYLADRVRLRIVAIA